VKVVTEVGTTVDRRESYKVHGNVSERWWNEFCFSPLYLLHLYSYITLFWHLFSFSSFSVHTSHPPSSLYFAYIINASSLASLGWLEAGWLGLACFAFSHLKFVSMVFFFP
jgi:hypothetical protein